MIPGNLQYNTAVDSSIERVPTSGGFPSLGGFPNSGIYIPSYNSINQIMLAPQYAGKVQFYEALGKYSQNQLKQRLAEAQSLEYQQAAIGINQAMKQASDQYLQSNPDGNGYTEFVTKTHKDLLNTSIKNASSSEVKQRLQMFGLQSSYDWANQAFQTQNTRQTAFNSQRTQNNIQSIINQVRSNPKNYLSLRKLFDETLEDSTAFIKDPIKKNEIKQKSLQTFIYSYALGTCDEHPDNAPTMILGSEFTNNLDFNHYEHLMNYAKGVKASAQAQREKSQKELMKSQKLYRSSIINEIKYKILTGAITPEEIIATPDLDDLSKQVLVNKLYTTNRKKNEDDKVYQAIHDAFQSGQSLDIFSEKAQEKWLNTIYVSETTRARTEGAEFTLPQLAMYARSCTHPMTQFTASIKSAITSKNKMEMLKGAEAYNIVAESSPVVVSQMPNRIINAINYINGQIAYGQDIGQTLEEAIKIIEKTDEYVQDKIDKYIDDADKINSVTKRLFRERPDEFFNRRVYDDVGITNKSIFIKDINNAMRGAIMGGAKDDDDIIKQSVARLNKIYSVTTINGFQQKMRYPPEKLAGGMELYKIKSNIGKIIQNTVDKNIKNGDNLLAPSINCDQNGMLLKNNNGYFFITIKEGKHNFKCIATLEPVDQGKYIIKYKYKNAQFILNDPNIKDSLYAPKIITIKDIINGQ